MFLTRSSHLWNAGWTTEELRETMNLIVAKPHQGKYVPFLTHEDIEIWCYLSIPSLIVATPFPKKNKKHQPLLIRARKSNIQLQQQQQQQQKSQAKTNTPSTFFSPVFGPPEKSVLFSSGDMLLTCTLSDCNDHRSLLCQGGIHMCQHVLQNQWLLATYEKKQPEQKASKRERFQGITVEFYQIQMGRFNVFFVISFCWLPSRDKSTSISINSFLVKSPTKSYPLSSTVKVTSSVQ